MNVLQEITSRARGECEHGPSRKMEPELLSAIRPLGPYRTYNIQNRHLLSRFKLTIRNHARLKIQSLPFRPQFLPMPRLNNAIRISHPEDINEVNFTASG